MKEITIHIVKITDRQDAEIATLLLSKEDASKFLNEEELVQRIYCDDKDVTDTLWKLDQNSPVYMDFIEANSDKFLFEVYPAEIFNTIKDNSTVTLKIQNDD